MLTDVKTLKIKCQQTLITTSGPVDMQIFCLGLKENLSEPEHRSFSVIKEIFNLHKIRQILLQQMGKGIDLTNERGFYVEKMDCMDYNSQYPLESGIDK